MNAIFPIAFFDAPQVLDASVTPIPASGSAPLQVVAALPQKAAYGLQYSDSTGDYIGVYVGPPGQEVLRTIIGNGLNGQVPVVLAAFSRVSLRSMTASPITSGKLNVVFLGMGM